jgi:hypothetical protein
VCVCERVCVFVCVCVCVLCFYYRLCTVLEGKASVNSMLPSPFVNDTREDGFSPNEPLYPTMISIVTHVEHLMMLYAGRWTTRVTQKYYPILNGYTHK